MIASQTGNRLVDTRSIAMVTVALHDAVSVTGGNVGPTYVQGLSTPGGDTRAAAAQAAYGVLSTLYPARIAQFAAARDQQLALIGDGAAKSDGIETGTAVANAVIALRSNDGSTAFQPYATTPGLTHWVQTGSAPFASPQWGAATPWLISSADAYLPGPPPDITSAQYAASLSQVATLGALVGSTRTTDQSNSAQFWATSPGNPLLKLAVDLAEGRSLSTAENARLFALLGVVSADAGIVTWDAKLTYDYWRPITAIQNADVDGNLLTSSIPGWQPYLSNPPYPGYSSGVAGVLGSDALLLQQFFSDATNLCIAHGTNAGLDRCWANFDELLTDMFNSRIYAGIHFDFDMSAGFELSRAVVTNALSSPAFTSAPEPGTWLTMLFGFAAVGMSIRRRSRPLRAATWRRLTDPRIEYFGKPVGVSQTRPSAALAEARSA
jgi:hypothetical protein